MTVHDTKLRTADVIMSAAIPDLPSTPELDDAFALMDLLPVEDRFSEECLVEKAPEPPLSFTPVIAGGAPRDLVLGKPVKDVDIFWPIARPWLMEATVLAFDSLRGAGYAPRTNNLTRDYANGAYFRPEMLGVITIHGGRDRLPIDVVLFDQKHGTSGAEIAATFDTSLSRIWIARQADDDGSSYPRAGVLPDFRQSVGQRKIWTYGHIPTRVSHLQRIAEKYPEYELVIADEDLKQQYQAHVARDEAAGGAR